MRTLRLDGSGLGLSELSAVADRAVRVTLAPAARSAMRASRRVVDRAIRSGERPPASAGEINAAAIS